MGYKAHEVKTVEDLCRPFTSMYFGAAYVNYLSHYGGIPRNEEFIVRGYVGGPGGITKNGTSEFWRKYNVAKAIYRK